ncbi:MAG TPA: DUF5615 family PIN-like protein [Tepidisphaeraceae bacterium]|nr:DUF5615 family PIN-like protein [Tepidisphaeraceae bacterium]
MSLKLVSNQCIPAQITNDLKRHGHVVTLSRDELPASAPDGDVIGKAPHLGAILISLNGNFADIVAYPPAAHTGVLAIQLHNHPETIPQLLVRLHALLVAHLEQQHYCRKLFIVENHRVRVRQ